jgi:FHA domain
MPTFEIHCEHCRSRYLLPVELRDSIRGVILVCSWCTREWTPLPIDSRGLLAAPSSARLPISLHPYLQANAFGPLSEPATPVAPIDPMARSTTQVFRSVAARPADPYATGATPAPAPAPDLSSTVRNFSALGIDANRSANPLTDIDVGLLGIDPPVAGETFWIKKSPTLVGRTGGDVVLADPRVSGKHAQIDVLALDQYSVKDLASTNGTTVNDRPASTARLKDGDIVAFGGVRVKFVARPKQRKG